MRYETVCITRHGFNLLHTECADFAAKVTYHCFESGGLYDPRGAIKSEWLVPLRNYWGE